MLIKKLRFNTIGSISILQFKTEYKSELEIKTLNYLIGIKQAEVKEVSSSGSVNNIIVSNKSMFYLFLMDGDILIGAKQNRILNTSVLICPNSSIEIPVSCVEHGRWSNNSINFSCSEHTVSPRFRANKASSVNKSFVLSQKHYSDQNYIWNMVSDELFHLNVNSPTSDYESVYNKDNDDFYDSFNEIQATNEGTGCAVFWGNKLLGVDIYGSSSLYTEYFDRILKAIAVTFNSSVKYSPVLEDESVVLLEKQLLDAENSIIQKGNGAGAGFETRFENENISGFELKYNNTLIHYTLLNKKS